MKKLLLFLFLFTSISCSSIRRENNRIYDIQKRHIFQSPYKDAKGIIIKIKAQRRYRLNTLPKTLKDKIFNQDRLSDTLLLLEDFDAVCFNCPSQKLQLIYQDTIYTLEKEIGKYNVKSERLNLESNDNKGYNLEYFELVEIKNKMNSGQNWLNSPLDYGSNYCFDGNHTIITAIYPDKKMNALYVRCWHPEKQREKSKN